MSQDNASRASSSAEDPERWPALFISSQQPGTCSLSSECANPTWPEGRLTPVYPAPIITLATLIRSMLGSAPRSSVRESLTTVLLLVTRFAPLVVPGFEVFTPSRPYAFEANDNAMTMAVVTRITRSVREGRIWSLQAGRAALLADPKALASAA